MTEVNKGTKLIILLTILGAIGIFGYKIALPFLQEALLSETSDAAGTKETIHIGTDSWAGYFPLCSPKMRKAMRNVEYRVVCEDDAADYDVRMKKLEDGDLQFAVATVDAYLLTGGAYDFPGTIVMVIDESKGGDAIVAYKDTADTIGKLKGNTQLKIAFTPASPSEHLLKSISSHFDIPELRKGSSSTMIEADGSEDAFKQLKSKKANVAVLWEPDVSKALSLDGVVKLMGTEKTSRLIIDVLLVNRKYMKKNPEVVQALIDTYFRVLKSYRDDPTQFEQDFEDEYDLKAETVKTMIKGVGWINLHDNASQWFGISGQGMFAEQGLIDSIESTVRTLRENGDVSDNPLPDSDPYLITHKAFIQSAFEKGLRGGFTTPGAAVAEQVSTNSLEAEFPSLTEAQWNALREVGTLKVEPINFQSGTPSLTVEGKKELDLIVDKLRHYPNFRVLVKGHTGVRGDATANRELSQDRADSVARYLMVTYGVNDNRIRSVGYGGDKPLKRLPGESNRAYGYRLPRVELALLSEVF